MMPREISPTETEVFRRLAKLLGARGAAVTNSRMTPEQRKARAKKAAAVRWRRYRQTGAAALLSSKAEKAVQRA